MRIFEVGTDPENSDECALAELPADVCEILEPPPLFATEDVDVYYNMLAMFARSIQPDGMILWMLVKDLADHRTEITRYVPTV